MQNIFSTKARRTNLAATIQLVPFVYASVTEKRNVASVCIEKNQHIETHLGCLQVLKRSRKFFSRVIFKIQKMNFC